MMETDDPHQFMQYMEDLTALGGGDEPEMCLSALQVTITLEDILSKHLTVFSHKITADLLLKKSTGKPPYLWITNKNLGAEKPFWSPHVYDCVPIQGLHLPNDVDIIGFAYDV